jgi:U4/U6.U5 tri-snRNP-associated protein 3
LNLDPHAPPYSNTQTPEPGEEMEDVQSGEEGEADQDEMMAMMGMSGFRSTKGKQVEGNQEGAANVKKVRTWRQYMNRYVQISLY